MAFKRRPVPPLCLTLILAAAALVAGAHPAAAQARRSPALEAALRGAEASERHIVWIYFRDKGDVEARLRESSLRLSARSLDRRARRGRLSRSGMTGMAEMMTFEDLPVAPEYLRAVAGRVSEIRHVSRWLNAVSAELSRREIEALTGLDFVSRLDLVRRFARGEPETSVGTSSGPPATGPEVTSIEIPDPIDYGSSFDQVEQIQIPAVHHRGFHGEGIVIAVFDTGFNNLSHPAFAEMKILAGRDFVNGDDDVADGRDRGNGSHGTATLSVVGSYAPGQLVGPAFAASFILAKTEDTQSETPVEEDHWAAAAEWAEALGADVISSSLGYLRYDDGFPSYSFQDMDGETAVITRAASLAAERGVVVVTSAGNGGFHLERNTLGAPADGKLVLSVGAVDTFGHRAEFSSVGPTTDGRIKPDVMAKGVLVRTATSSGAGYVASNGTSFACPLTAGVVALVLQVHPDWPVEKILFVMRETADRSDSPDRLMGWGIVNALEAIQWTSPPPIQETARD